MEKPILYYARISPPARAVVMTAAAIGLELDIRHLDFKSGEHVSEEFLKKNPQHTVPTLDDNGVYLFDSHVICGYLIDKYAKNDQLYPKDLVKRSLVDTRLYFEAGYMYPRVRFIIDPVVYGNYLTDFSEERKDYARKAYDILEAFLNDGPFVCGDQMTIADLSLVSMVSNMDLLVPPDSQKHSKMLQWIKKMEQLPYYEENRRCAIDGQTFYFEAQKAKLVDPNAVWVLLEKYNSPKQ